MSNSVNLALNKATTASGYIKPYNPAKAVDGSCTPFNRWLCNGVNATPATLVVDLGTVYIINRWVVRHMPAAGWGTPDYCMSDFKLQASTDNVKWTDIDTVVGNTVGITDRYFTTVAYRYVRLYVTKGLRCNPQMASIMEFEVYQALSAYLISGTGLTVSSGALSPAFVNNVFNYTTPNVANSVTSVAVNPTAEDPTATIKVNNVTVASGNSTNVGLNVGSNDIKVVVTSADGKTTNTYTVTVIRDAAPVAYLTGLALSTTATPSVSVPYTPTPFNKDTTAYSASVGYDVDKIVVTPTTDISGATITVNGTGLTGGSATINLAVGANSIPVVVTNGTATKTYTVTVTRAAASPYLTGLVVTTDDGSSSMTPGFNKDIVNYSMGADSGSSSNLLVTATVPDSSYSITINGQSAASGATISIPLTTPVVVKAILGGVEKAYTINVNISR